MGGSAPAQLARARLALFQGRYRRVTEELARIGEELPRAEGEQRDLLSAVALHQLGDAEAAAALLRGLVSAQRESAHWEHDLLGSVPYQAMSDVLSDLPAGVPQDEAAALTAAHRALPKPYRAVQYQALTPTELEVVRALSRGDSMEDTASSLYISKNTLGSHRRSIYAKLGASDRAEMTAAAWRLGLLD